MSLPGIPGTMDADNFEFTPGVKRNTDICTMHVRHKFTGRTWEREFAEAEWPTVRVELLETIKRDIETPSKEAAP